MKAEQTPYELTLDLINKSGVDVHHASVSKHCATIEMTQLESEHNVKKVVTEFNRRWGHAYKYSGHSHNSVIGCTMIYFEAI